MSCIIPETLDDDFEDVLFCSWVPLAEPIKSAEQLRATCVRRGDGFVSVTAAEFPSELDFTTTYCAVKTSTSQMVVCGEKVTAQTDAKQAENVDITSSQKLVFLRLDLNNNPHFEKEWVHETDVDIDNYIEYKGLEILFGQDQFLHLYYKGQKSALKLVRGKYYTRDDFFNKGKKVFRRGQFLFYPNKYSQGMHGPFIGLMRVDLDVLIQQVELSFSNKKHKSYDLGDGNMTNVSRGFKDFILDNDDIFLLYECGRVRRFRIDEEECEGGKYDNKLSLRYYCITIAVPGKYLVAVGSNPVKKLIRFNLVNHDQELIANCLIEDSVLADCKMKFSHDGSDYVVWGHFRKYINASVGVFFRPLCSVDVVAVMKNRIIHVYQRGFEKEFNKLQESGTPVAGSKANGWVGIIPFSGQKKYFVMGQNNQVAVLHLKL